MDSKFLPLLSLLLCPLAGLQAASAPVQKPNVILILADDLGWRDLGCQGSTFYETPNLDNLAKRGVRFTNAYAACSVCSPTRASILSGQSPARLHLTDWLPGQASKPTQPLLAPKIVGHLPADQVSLPMAFKQAGYVTGMIGKWHLGGKEFYPANFGFDVNIAGCELGHPPSYFSPYRIPTLSDGSPGEYLTDRLSEEAERFIEANKDKPFLLYLPHYAVHNPQQAKPAMIAKWKAKAAALPPADGPEFAPDIKFGTKARQIQNQPVYGAMLQSLDEGVGRVVAKLDALGLTQNTLIIFFSDNGGLSTSEGSPTSNMPLRGGKGWPYEGGVREPLIVSWPGVVQPGALCETPVVSTDFYPTLLDAAGLPPQPAPDGKSFLPLLKGQPVAERPIFWHYPHYSNQGGGPNGAMRLGDFKLVEWYEDMRLELFNLSTDPGEHHDLAAEMPEKAAAMQQQLHAWRGAVGAEMPAANPKYVPAKSVLKAGSINKAPHADD